MLRVSGATPAPPQDPETTPPVENVAPAPEDGAPVDDHKEPSSKFDAEKVNPIMVHYMTADMGPFECQRCSHWEAPNACILVSGKIDPAGCCNLFEPSDDGMDDGTSPEDPSQAEGAEAPLDEPENPPA